MIIEMEIQWHISLKSPKSFVFKIGGHSTYSVAVFPNKRYRDPGGSKHLGGTWNYFRLKKDETKQYFTNIFNGKLRNSNLALKGRNFS